MSYSRGVHLAFLSVPIVLVLSGCEAAPECDSSETRTALLAAVSDDHNNPLVNFAARTSTAKPTPENSKPLYLLGEKLVMTSKSKDGKTLQCSGAISATVGDTKASKEIDFSVQRAKDGKISVAVTPFQF